MRKRFYGVRHQTPSHRAHSSAAAPTAYQIVDGGGRVLTNPKVFTLFVGDWSGETVTSFDVVDNATAVICQSDYLAQARQYRNAGTSLAKIGNLVVSDPQAPVIPKVFANSDVEALLGYLIGQKLVPSDDAEILYLVFLPQGYQSAEQTGSGVILGEHNCFSSAKGKVVYGWIISFGDLDGDMSITATFAHELAEAVTDPELDAIAISGADPTQLVEIGDTCQGGHFQIDGITVQGYWSAVDNGCTVAVDSTGGGVQPAPVPTPDPLPTPDPVPTPDPNPYPTPDPIRVHEIKPGAQGEDVNLLQQLLATAGYRKDVPSGFFDRSVTMKEVQHFQVDHQEDGLVVSGEVDADTWMALWKG